MKGNIHRHEKISGSQTFQKIYMKGNIPFLTKNSQQIHT